MSNPHSLLLSAIADGVFPGAAYAYGSAKGVERGYVGHQTYCPDSPKIDSDALWDLASVSKIVGTTGVAMRRVQQGRLDLDRTVASYLPEFGNHGKEAITVRNLLRHDAGLVAFRPYHKSYTDRRGVIEAIMQEGLTYPIGTKSVYSDLSMIAVAELLTRKANSRAAEMGQQEMGQQEMGQQEMGQKRGKSFEELVGEEVTVPLGMTHTGYFSAEHPYGSSTIPLSRSDAVPTERTEDWRAITRRAQYGDLLRRRLFGEDPEYIQAEVHDPTATVLGGVAGHAGLFSTLGDLVLFAQEMLHGTHFDPAVKAEFTRRQEEKSSRGLGWDTRSPEKSWMGSFGEKSYGHTGYTGTSIAIDPDAGNFAVLLTNRVHPSAENTKLIAFRSVWHTAIAETLYA